MNEDLTNVELVVLYDLLAANTANYTQMLSQGIANDEFDQCKQNILRIQAEIDRRVTEKRFIIPENEIDFFNQHYR